MALQPKDQRLLGASQNTNAPQDLLQPPDSAIVQNFRVDRAGVLQSRHGAHLLVSGLGSNAEVNSFMRWGDRRYAGVGEYLFEGPVLGTQVEDGFDGEPLGLSPYMQKLWVMNRAKRRFVDGSTPYQWGIDPPETELTLTPDPVVSAEVAEFEEEEGKQLLWVQNNEVRDPYALTIYDPGAGTVATTSGDNTLTGTDTEFANYDLVGQTVRITWSGGTFETTVASITSNTAIELTDAPTFSESGLAFDVVQPVDALMYDDSNKKSGNESLHVAAWGEGIWRVYTEDGDSDYSLDGFASNGDEFRMWFYAQDPTGIKRLLIAFEDTNGVVVQAEYDPAKLSQDLYSWTQISILRGFDERAALTANEEYRTVLAQLQDAIDAENTILIDSLNLRKEQLAREIISGVVSFKKNTVDEQVFDWVHVRKFYVEVEVTQMLDFHLDRAEFVGGLEASLQGEYTYYVTYGNDFGHESNPGPGTSIILNKQSVAISGIPVSADPQVTVKYLYREGGSVNRPLRLATLNPAATTHNDSLSDATLDELGSDMAIDNDLPPAARGLLPEPYLGRLIAWDIDDNRQRLFWTPVARPYAFPEDNYDDIGQDAEAIVRVTNKKRALWIYKERSIWIYPGDPDVEGNIPIKSNSSQGLAGPKALAERGGIDYFLGSEAIYRFNGESEEKITDAIDPLFKGQYVELAGDLVFPPMDRDYIAECVLGIVGERLYFFYPEVGYTVPNVGAVCDLQTGRWTRYAGYETAATITALRYEGPGLQFLAGTYNGTVWELESGQADGALQIPLLWQSATIDCGMPNNPKQFGDVVVDFQTGIGNETPETLTVEVLFDNGQHVRNLGTLNSGTRIQKVFRIEDGEGFEATNAAVRISGDVQNASVFLYSAFIHWYPIARKALTYDSEVVDLGTNKLKMVEALEVDVTASGNWDWHVESDMPGAVIDERETGEVSAVADGTRRTITIPLTDGVEGKRFRFWFTSASEFQVHGVLVRFKVVGDYYDAGDQFDSGNVDLRDVNLLRWLEIIADTESQCTVEVQTEIPGLDVAQRFTATFNSNTTSTGLKRVPFQFSLPGLQGQIVRVKITWPTGGLRLYGIRIFARATGPAAGDWRYIDAPAFPVYMPTQAIEFARLSV